ncbi:MAG: DHH family phosphoesterase [Candidatus Thermoplasmatota archaeon]
MLEVPDEMEKKLDSALSILEDHDKFRIITHYDADGISAAAVLTRCLMRDQSGFHTSFVDSFPEEIPEGLPLIFTDIGNSHLEDIAEIEEDVIVLDHHDIKGEFDLDDVELDEDNKVFINPHEHGINGAQEVSGGTLALLLSVWHDEVNWEDSIYGLAGAAADKQAIGGFNGLNLELADKAVKEDFLEERKELFIDGQGLRDALMKACDPYFPDISGRKKRIDKVIRDLNLDPEAKIRSISKDKRRKLNSLLVLSLLKKDRSAEVIESIIGVHYWSKHESFDMDTLYKLLNSCARTDRPGLGLSICLGDKKALDEAKDIRNEYREEMITKLKKLEKKVESEEYEHLQYFFEEKKTRKGELAGLGILYLLDRDNPVFGIAEEDDQIDISARATREMVEEGLDLGSLCRKVSEGLEGTGGGHDIAAGAAVKKEDMKTFLSRMNEEIGGLSN